MAKEVISTKPNDICKECMFWKEFKHECWVHWYDKKFCTMQVTENNDFKEVKDIYKLDDNI